MNLEYSESYLDGQITKINEFKININHLPELEKKAVLKRAYEKSKKYKEGLLWN